MREILIFVVSITVIAATASSLFILAANKLENYFNQFKK